VKNLFIILLILPCFFFPAHAQQGNYVRGYALTTQGDTLKGLIQWKKNFKCKELIQFKKSLSDSPQPLSLEELVLLRNQDENKVIFVVEMEMQFEYVDPIDLSLQYNDSTKKLHVPLKPLYDGDSLSLYVYHEKTDYFFLRHGNILEQLLKEYRLLTDHERLVHSNRILPAYVTYDTWRVQLYSVYDFNSDKKLYNLSLDAKFEDYNLTRLVTKMDQNLSKLKIK